MILSSCWKFEPRRYHVTLEKLFHGNFYTVKNLCTFYSIDSNAIEKFPYRGLREKKNMKLLFAGGNEKRPKMILSRNNKYMMN